jgi:hypothetical protein
VLFAFSGNCIPGSEKAVTFQFLMKKPLNIKKLVLLNLPYILMGLFATNFGEAWRMAQGADASEKALSRISVFPARSEVSGPAFTRRIC